jgi:hypothetical protein
LAFLAWCDGLQPNRMLPNHAERSRDAAHLWRAAELAAASGVFSDAESTAARLERYRIGT